MSRIAERIIALLVILFLLSYVGYQAYRYYYSPVETEIAYEYTVARSVSTRGIAVREEMVLDRSAEGVQHYPYQDASRVAIGSPVAEYYRSSGNRDLKRVRELEEEIARLQQAQETVSGNLAGAEVYNRDIKTQVARLSAMASEGQYADLADIRRNVTLLINKKQISTGKVTGFAPRIRQLEKELEGIGRVASENALEVVTAPVSGYFSKMVDGYEARITPDMLKDMEVADYQKLIDAKTPTQNTVRVGKMVLSEKWTFAAPVASEHLEWINEALKEAKKRGVPVQVNVQFEQVPQPVLLTIDSVVEQKDSDTAVLLLRCNQVSEELFDLRIANATLNFQQYTGIRIDSANLRFLGERRGVYILDDQRVRFKEIDPVYEEQDFLLSKTYYVGVEQTQYVRLFDKVIVKGTDLYDGKVIQDY